MDRERQLEIWSSVSGKTHTMSSFLAVFFFLHFFSTCSLAKEMIRLNKNSSTPTPKLDLENSVHQSFATLQKIPEIYIYIYTHTQLVKEEITVEILH